MGIHISITLVGLRRGCEYGSCINGDVMKSCTWIVMIILCWSYSFPYDLDMMLFILITSMFTWFCGDFGHGLDMELSHVMLCSLTYTCFWVWIKAFQSNLARFWTNVPLSRISMFYVHMIPYIVQVVVLNHFFYLLFQTM